jgi:hypothetical protein
LADISTPSSIKMFQLFKITELFNVDCLPLMERFLRLISILK